MNFFSFLQMLWHLIFGAPPKRVWTLDSTIGDTHFTWRQALTQGTTGKFGIPTEEQEQNIIKQAQLLVKIEEVIGTFRITSWLRTVEHHLEIYAEINRKRTDKGLLPMSVPTQSAHLVGGACDLVPDKCTVEDAKKKIRASNPNLGAFEINTTNWLHIDVIHPRDFYA